MNFLSVPDYVNALGANTTYEIIANFVLWMLAFYGSMILFMALNMILIIIVSYSMLIVCRLFGIPWVDGTKSGYFNRK